MIAPNNMSLGPTRGHAIHLAPAGPTLLISEGIETVLSGVQAMGLPGWSAISAGNMECLMLPAVVRRVVILADNDATGAARRTAATPSPAKCSVRCSAWEPGPDAGGPGRERHRHP